MQSPLSRRTKQRRNFNRQTPIHESPPRPRIQNQQKSHDRKRQLVSVHHILQRHESHIQRPLPEHTHNDQLAQPKVQPVPNPNPVVDRRRLTLKSETQAESAQLRHSFVRNHALGHLQQQFKFGAFGRISVVQFEVLEYRSKQDREVADSGGVAGEERFAEKKCS